MNKWGWGCSSSYECLPSMQEALGLTAAPLPHELGMVTPAFTAPGRSRRIRSSRSPSSQNKCEASLGYMGLFPKNQKRRSCVPVMRNHSLVFCLNKDSD